ncbi:pyridoxine kinase [Hydrogenoanaerobacterium saccharovorans]|uniref:pyridoxal kinase n=1 Tax=Hydrogenoanaerobacterium saccharovorans TaxID=474960 RepID=A0A1H8DL47_9FIRM|nr:pyridoxamine kinase [Hydrogenoanaerobacterium saccharovorans]RPF42271.1 pyridoxine kinase [Hydrogenoanaerobacterium saccharovorans]SEN08051.1 pyridoxine kinase [Hydrogenoanaerobacterium saccharovorans]
MYKRPQRVAAIHDLSGFGRCSLTVILPVLSAMGVQVCPVPTAVLSTHTGGFGEVEFRDLTDYTIPALEHYKRLDLEFECIYSGFLGSEAQIDHCLDFFAAYPNALSVVDPVMGDHGKPYKTYTATMQRRMIELAAVADIITPNLTEACILLGEPYIFEPLTQSLAKSMLVRLAEKGPRFVVITGVNMAVGTMSNIGYDKERTAFWCVDCDYVPVSYPGTGDIFASVLTGGFLSGDSLPIAMSRATQFVETAIKTTFSYGTEPREGVMLERTLHMLKESDFVSKYRIL